MVMEIMLFNDSILDAVVIGGGFYGAAVALYLAKQRGLSRIVLLEQEKGLLTHASYHNQARIHQGYHYPRSMVTAFRSRVNFSRFIRDWSDATYKNITKLYAIARRNSKVGAKQFRRVCDEIEAPIWPCDESLRRLFNLQLIEEIFGVEEYAFDANKLALWAEQSLRESAINVRYETRAEAIFRNESHEGGLTVHIQHALGQKDVLSARYVMNCTYSGLNQLGGHYQATGRRLKHEIAEMGLMEVPEPLLHVGITVMDGPFFSLMPFPARGLHSLSHVRYTPHMSWLDEQGKNPYNLLADYEKQSRVDRMVRDASRYVPLIANARHIDSFYEVKTILLHNESDDGRPILLELNPSLPGCYSVLGSKIDNIYDIWEALDAKEFLQR
jgi:hypothetical protein